MVGYVRLLLATGVMLSHLGITLAGYNIGVMSVVIFFLLAGSTTSFLFNKIYVDHPQRIRAFYQDRIKRLFPLYLYVLALVAIFIYATGHGQPTSSPWPWLLNALIVPLNYYMVFSADVLAEPALIAIPAAWSLGLELQVYILLPLLLLYKPLRKIAFASSLLIYLVAASGIIDTDIWGYRLLPGTLFIFLIGVAMRQQLSAEKPIWTLWWLFWLAGFMAVYIDAFVWDDIRSFRLETLVGLVIGVPLLILLRRISWQLPANRWCADMSYGLFLTHSLDIVLLEYFSINVYSMTEKVILLFGLSLALALPGVLVTNKLYKR